MIRTYTDGPNGPTYIFGLARENINRLIEGKPILVDLGKEFGTPGVMILLFGETEEAIALELSKHLNIKHVIDKRPIR